MVRLKHTVLRFFAGALTIGSALSSALAATGGDCPVIDTADWTARVEDDLFTQQLRLVVYGRALLPTPGYVLTIKPSLNAKTYPPVQFFELEFQSPQATVTPVLAWTDIVYEGPADAATYRLIKVLCEGEEIGEIQNVEKAQPLPRFQQAIPEIQ